MAVLALLLTACADIVTLELPTVEGVARTPPSQSVVYDADGDAARGAAPRVPRARWAR
jgi:hypothetical protein